MRERYTIGVTLDAMSARQNADEVHAMDSQYSRLIQISLTDLFIHPRAIVACQFERDLILQCDVTAVKPDPQSSVQNEHPVVVSAGMDYLVVSGWAELFDAHRENRKRIFVVCVSFIDDSEVEYLALRYVYKRFTNQLEDSTYGAQLTAFLQMCFNSVLDRISTVKQKTPVSTAKEISSINTKRIHRQIENRMEKLRLIIEGQSHE